MGFNMVFIRFPEGKAKAFTMSYDDGVKADVQLIEIMRKNGLKGTFNINSGSYAPEGTEDIPRKQIPRMTKAQCMKTFKGDDIEVAVHGLIHAYPAQLPADKQTYEFMEDRRRLEEQFGNIVKGCAYAFGQYDNNVIETLRRCGIKYARTVESTRSFELPTNWLTLKPTCHHNDPSLMKLADNFLTIAPKRCPQMFYLWGHSYEFDSNNNWNVIEEFAEKIGGHDDVWYATNIEICNYVEAFYRLEFTLDESKVYNPNCISVWIKPGEDKETVEIKPGEWVNL